MLWVNNFKTGSTIGVIKFLLINFATAVKAITTIWTFEDAKSFYNVATNKINSSLSLSKNKEQQRYPILKIIQIINTFFNARFLDYVRLTAWIWANEASCLKINDIIIIP